MFPSIESTKGSLSPTTGNGLSELLERSELHYSSQDELSNSSFTPRPKPSTSDYVCASFDFKARSEEELGFKEGDVILLEEKVGCYKL
jgi:hypothetical protein